MVLLAKKGLEDDETGANLKIWDLGGISWCMSSNKSLYSYLEDKVDLLGGVVLGSYYLGVS